MRDRLTKPFVPQGTRRQRAAKEAYYATRLQAIVRRDRARTVVAALRVQRHEEKLAALSALERVMYNVDTFRPPAPQLRPSMRERWASAKIGGKPVGAAVETTGGLF